MHLIAIRELRQAAAQFPDVASQIEDWYQALATVEALMHKTELTPEEDRLYDLLLVLIEKFEQENYPLQNLSTPHSRLLHLLDSNHLKQTDLLDVFRSSGIASEVINGKREISKTQARKLGERFGVSPALFLM
jgi:HTH-type transcriptional regulator / antitoxin HigA